MILSSIDLLVTFRFRKIKLNCYFGVHKLTWLNQSRLLLPNRFDADKMLVRYEIFHLNSCCFVFERTKLCKRVNEPLILIHIVERIQVYVHVSVLSVAMIMIQQYLRAPIHDCTSKSHALIYQMNPSA